MSPDSNARPDAARRRLCLAILGVGPAIAFAQAASPRPVGSVIDMNGQVKAMRDGASVKVDFFDNIFEGQSFQLAGGAMLVATHRPTKSEYTFNGPAEVEFRANQAPMVRGAPPKVRQLGDFAVVALNRLATSGAARMRSFGLAADLDSDTVSSLSPVFTWPARAEVVAYRVRVHEWINREPGPELVNVRVTGAQWVPAAKSPLDWGRTYYWAVSEEGSGTPVKRALRVVVDADAGRTLAELRPSDASSVAQLVVYAQSLEWAGARDEAREVWVQASSMRPEASQFRRKAAAL